MLFFHVIKIYSFSYLFHIVNLYPRRAISFAIENIADLFPEFNEVVVDVDICFVIVCLEPS